MLNNTFTNVGVTVVLVAELQNPAIINHDFLENSGIVPADWGCTPSTTTPSFSTPAFARVVYQNGLSVIVEQDRCVFQQMKISTSDSEYQVYECVRKYAEKFEYNYLALGLNWHIKFVRATPEAWLKNRFFQPGKWKYGLTPTTIAFRIPGPDSSTCNFTLHTGQKLSQVSNEKPFVLLECNLDFELQDASEKAERISDILQKRKKHEHFLEQKLSKYFEGDLV